MEIFQQQPWRPWRLKHGKHGKISLEFLQYTKKNKHGTRWFNMIQRWHESWIYGFKLAKWWYVIHAGCLTIPWKSRKVDMRTNRRHWNWSKRCTKYQCESSPNIPHISGDLYPNNQTFQVYPDGRSSSTQWFCLKIEYPVPSCSVHSKKSSFSLSFNDHIWGHGHALTNIAIKNGDLSWIYPLNMVISHSIILWSRFWPIACFWCRSFSLDR